MKTTYLFKWPLWIGLCLGVIACIDHQSPEPKKMRVKSLVRILPEEPGVRHVSLLTYDSQGKLNEIFTYQTPDSAANQTETSTYQYDNLDRLSEMLRIRSGGEKEHYLYSYDPAGKLAAIKYTSADHTFYDFLLAYDGNGKLLSTKRSFNFFSALSYVKLNTYSFNENNLSRVVATTTIKRVVPGTWTETADFVFDSHPNPFYGNVLIPAPVRIASPTTGNFGHYTYYGGIDNVLHLSENNVVSSSVDGRSKTTFNYTYESSGLPASRETLASFTIEGPAQLTETLLYEYEAY
ncbi:hypothetical protein [Salmonirosea aquatica]|uniref:DUF4595 domain-containing protein n=1 Tax=Salmonirosea aquatica TaxID=2654236 RepID=A0A7C9F6U1_9BACT|nr:hypothetical protein [Cytophagaceae bacterium SJW1-29]